MSTRWSSPSVSPRAHFSRSALTCLPSMASLNSDESTSTRRGSLSFAMLLATSPATCTATCGSPCIARFWIQLCRMPPSSADSTVTSIDEDARPSIPSTTARRTRALRSLRAQRASLLSHFAPLTDPLDPAELTSSEVPSSACEPPTRIPPSSRIVPRRVAFHRARPTSGGEPFRNTLEASNDETGSR